MREVPEDGYLVPLVRLVLKSEGQAEGSIVRLQQCIPVLVLV